MDPKELAKMIADQVSKAVAERAVAAKPAATAHDEIVKSAQEDRPIVTNVRPATKGSGIELARFIKAQLAAKMQGGGSAADVLKSWGYADQAKALSQDSFSGMGSLVHTEWAADFIELLRNKSVIRAAGANVIQMGASLNFGGQATAATAAYVGETTNIATSNPTTSEPVILSEKKLAALVPIPNDLIRNVSVGAELFVRNDLLKVMALTEDSKFVYGSGASYEPRGLKSRLKSTHTYAMTALTTAKIPLIGELKKEFNKAKRIMKQANADMTKCAWILNPVTEAGIMNAIGPGGEGYNVFEREMLERGTLAGFPFFVTNQIPDNGTSVDLFLYDFSEVILGESMALEVETFPNAAYYNGSTVVSGISSDQSVVRALAKHDIALRHDVAGINVTGVTWGEP